MSEEKKLKNSENFKLEKEEELRFEIEHKMKCQIKLIKGKAGKKFSCFFFFLLTN